MKNIFTEVITKETIARIENLSIESKPLWGKMSVAQMLAHLSVQYEMVYTDLHKKPNAIIKFILKTFIKKAVVSNKPFPKNGRTAPQFIIANKRDFQTEKKRLIAFLTKTQQLGENEFNGRESHSFGKLNAQEWNNIFYKHLDHHLNQFGV